MTADIMPCAAEYEEFLHDESKRVGAADAIAFPTSEAEVIAVVTQARERGLAITVQGARTGIVAGAVPEGGLIVNLSRMNSIGDVGGDTLTVQPGALLFGGSYGARAQRADVSTRSHRDDRVAGWNGRLQCLGGGVVSLWRHEEVG